MMRTKQIIAICLAVMIAALCCACSGSSSPKDASDKVFNCKELSITLTSAFADTGAQSGYTGTYDSKEVAVLLLREAKDEFPAGTTFDDYAGYVLQANANKGVGELQKIGGLTCVEYDYYNADVKTEFHYLTAIFEADEAFWLVQFATAKEKAADYRDTVIKWAQSVKFN